MDDARISVYLLAALLAQFHFGIGGLLAYLSLKDGLSDDRPWVPPALLAAWPAIAVLYMLNALVAAGLCFISGRAYSREMEGVAAGLIGVGVAVSILFGSVALVFRYAGR